MDRRATNQSGFTLIELLVVIAVLGTLSGVTVAGVSAFRSRAQDSACDTDRRTLATAQEVAFTQHGRHMEEAELVSTGVLADGSDLHDVVLSGDGYELVPVGECAGGGEELAEGTDGGADGEAEAEKAAEEQAARDKAAAEEQAAKERAAAEEAAKEAAAATPADAPEGSDEQAAKEKAAAEERAKAEEAARAEEAAKAAEEATRTGTGCLKGTVDINTADKKALREIVHVGGDEATRIEKQRPFKSVEQLVEVKGLDERDVKDIMKQGLACASR